MLDSKCMAVKIALIRLLTAVAATLIACVFVSLYNTFSSLIIGRGAALPMFTAIVVEYNRWAYVVPVFVFLLGLVFLRRGDDGAVGLECTISVAWLSALLWILFAIWAWQLPRIRIID